MWPVLCMRLLREDQTVHYPVQRYKEKPFIPLAYSEKLFLLSHARARKARSRSASDAGFCCVSELFLLRFRAVSAAFQSCFCGGLESFLRRFRAVPAVFQNCFCGVSRLFLWWFWSVSFGGLWWCSYPTSLLSRICRLFAPILVKECKSRGSECLTMVNDTLCSVK